MSGSYEFEIVPNVSEGRDRSVIDACVAAMETEGAQVVHRMSDPVHHRSVITAIGRASQVVAASVALARVAHARIDLRRHRGAHPRIGALDVLPFVPLGAATLDEAVSLAHRAAARIWRELGIPSYLYGAAASAPHRAHLAEIGARPFLIAYNVELASDDLALAKGIARTLRASNGGLRSLKCLGLRLGAGRVQVSCNLTDVDAVPLYRVTELIRRAAARRGVAVARSELIGLAPRRTVERTARAYAAAERSPYPS